METIEAKHEDCTTYAVVYFGFFLSHAGLFPAEHSDHQICSCVKFISHIITVAEMKEKKQHFRLSLIKHQMNIWWRLLTSILKNKAYWKAQRFSPICLRYWSTGNLSELASFFPIFIHLREKQNEKYTKYEERVSKNSEQWELCICLLTRIKWKILLQSSSKDMLWVWLKILNAHEWEYYQSSING